MPVHTSRSAADYDRLLVSSLYNAYPTLGKKDDIDLDVIKEDRRHPGSAPAGCPLARLANQPQNEPTLMPERR